MDTLSPIRPMVDLSAEDEELIIEEESEEEAQTSDEEVLPILVHDPAPIEIDDDEVSVMSPKASEDPAGIDVPPPPPVGEAPLDESQRDPVYLSPEMPRTEELPKDETMQVEAVEELMDSDDEGGKENDKSKGTFKVGTHLRHHW